MQLSTFLRTILKLDAASCLGMAALVLPAAGALQDPLGIDAALLTAAATSLVSIGLFILWLGTRREAAAGLVWLVILGNLGWTAASLFAAANLAGVTALGQLAVAAQGLAVLALALAEFAGLRQSRAAIA
ncbi:MAG: hypothetical protein M3Q19_00065 [Pseudomonadota bacterium]|nr:hypothetical protein [Pseudomonadota bacterium]